MTERHEPTSAPEPLTNLARLLWSLDWSWSYDEVQPGERAVYLRRAEQFIESDWFADTMARARAEERERVAAFFERADRDGYLFLDSPPYGRQRVPWLNVAHWLRNDAAADLDAGEEAK